VAIAYQRGMEGGSIDGTAEEVGEEPRIRAGLRPVAVGGLPPTPYPNGDSGVGAGAGAIRGVAS